MRVVSIRWRAQAHRTVMHARACHRRGKGREEAFGEEAGVRRIARVDANQNEIVKAFRQLGCTVQSLATVGSGCPDLVVGIPKNRVLLVEVKDGDKELTPDQERWHANWATPVHIVRHLGEVISLVNAYR